MYTVSFYTPSGKLSPIQDFTDNSEKSARAKVMKKIAYLVEFGLTKDVPDLKRITDTPLWEVRILGRENIRLFCAALPNKVIKVLHIFTKKKQKTPKKEIKIALTRYTEITQSNT